MTKIIIVAYVLCVSSCAYIFNQGPKTDAPGLAEAREIARDIYGRTGTPPTVALTPKQALTCRNSPGTEMTGFGFVGISDKGQCMEGLTLTATWVIVAWVGQPWSQTTVCHELRHAYHMADLIFDPRHTLPDWKVGGLVEQCNDALRAVGK